MKFDPKQVSPLRAKHELSTIAIAANLLATCPQDGTLDESLPHDQLSSRTSSHEHVVHGHSPTGNFV